MSVADSISIDYKGRTPPAYIAVEGSIGVGKTTLAKALAASFNHATVLEDAEENPGFAPGGHVGAGKGSRFSDR